MEAQMRHMDAADTRSGHTEAFFSPLSLPLFRDGLSQVRRRNLFLAPGREKKRGFLQAFRHSDVIFS